jgi:DNA-binding MarR family transcriptional regulator
MQYPGPDGVRPGVLAERAGMSKQAMNQLLRSLEGYGYVERTDAPDEGRAGTVHFTKRGRAAYAIDRAIIAEHLREALSPWEGIEGAARWTAETIVTAVR